MSSRPRAADTPTLGVTEFFRPGEHERVERALSAIEGLGIEHLRTLVSWADWHADGGREWYAWLLPRLSRRLEVLPSVFYTPPSIAVEPRSGAPPRRPRDYADFLDLLLDEHGRHFEWVGLWNEPNNLNNWDWRLDPAWEAFSSMIVAAGHWVRKRGWKTLLGGMCPTDPNWLRLMVERGVLDHIDAVGVHGFPGTWEYDWKDWHDPLSRIAATLESGGVPRPLWITEAGFSTWRHDEYRQLLEFERLLHLPVERVYWYAAEDLEPGLPTEDGHFTDPRHYHMGLWRSDGTPKLLPRLMRDGGIPAVRAARALSEGGGSPDPAPRRRTHPAADGDRVRKTALITGGAGFVGTNLTDRLARSGHRVIVADNLSRPGVEENLRWLLDQHGDRVRAEMIDVRDRHRLAPLVHECDWVFHLAAQVAVTTSLIDPRLDFDVNARGTLNLLEVLRSRRDPPLLVFTSTNKVYGELRDVPLGSSATRYEARDDVWGEHGVDERRPLDFHSPYGCSKGAAEQYVLDYARTFGLPALVLRMSCIYGPHQHGTEDQGWVAHFLLRALRGEEISIFGDGRQVRDILYVDDLVDALVAVLQRGHELTGRVFNIGGGRSNSVSLLEVLGLIADLVGERPRVRFRSWRPGDQLYYVSDTRRLQDALGWRAVTGVRTGLRDLYRWFLDRHDPGSSALDSLRLPGATGWVETG